MKLAYGRNRKERDFKEYDVDDVYIFIDTDRTERTHRADMFQIVEIGFERGDEVTLYLLSWGDLGHGADLVRQRQKLEQFGTIVEVANAKPKRPRGRPKGSADFAPTPEHDAEIKVAWHDDGRTPKGVIAIADRRGYQVTLSQLKYRYGPRFK